MISIAVTYGLRPPRPRRPLSKLWSVTQLPADLRSGRPVNMVPLDQPAPEPMAPII
jgi:hypothetical protein